MAHKTDRVIEKNFVPLAKIQYGTPQLSKSKIDLYPKKMEFAYKPMKKHIIVMLEILNLAEGKKDLLDICNSKNFKLIEFIDLYEKLLKSKYIKKIKDF